MKSVIVPNLTGSRQGVTSVAGLIKGDSHLLLRTEATETAFKALPLADFRIIHLAVHGVSDTHFPDRAALVLGSSSSGDDGLLRTADDTSKFAQGTQVQLTATPPAGLQFVNWAGACSGSNPTCTVAITRDTSVQAVFSK